MSIRQRLVIDTNVLRSAGGANAAYPISIRCRETLFAILKICHKAALSPALREEWDEHQSKYAIQWRSAMQKRGKIIPIDVTEKPGLRQKIIEVHQQARTKQEAATKDFHLVEAAIEADWIIISLDDIARQVFADACIKGDKLSQIVWVNPEDEDILMWLEGGAIHQEERQLRAYISDL